MGSREVEQYLRRLQKDPDDAAAFLALRNLYDSTSDHVSLAALLEARAERLRAKDAAACADLLYRASEIWLDKLSDVQQGGGALVRALEADPLHRNAGLRLEQLYREAGDFRSLIHTLERRAQALNERDGATGASTRYVAAIHHQLGEVWHQQFHSQERAISHYRKAFEIDPSCVAAYYAAREIYRNLGNFKTAAVLYDLEANAEPEPVRKVALYRELAHMRTEKLGDVEGAVVALKRAAAIAPSDMPVMQELASTLLQRAEAGGAEQDKRRAADLFYQLAQMADVPETVGYCEAALDACPDHEGALGLLTEQIGLSVESDLLRERYRAFLKTAPDSPHAPEVRRWLGRLAAEKGQLEEAIQCFEALREGGDPGAAAMLADLYRRSGRPSDLAKSIASSLDSLPLKERVPRIRELAELHLSLGETDEAAVRMAELLRLDLADPEAFAFLEDYYRDRADWFALKELLLGAVRVPGASLASRVLRLRSVASICEEQLEDMEGAVMAWRGLAALDPSDSEARTSLQRLLAAAGKWEDLVKVLEKEALATVDLGAKIGVYRRLAEVHATKRHDAAAACAALHRILEMAPGDQPAIVALEDAYEAAGRFGELADLLRKRIEQATEPGIRTDLRKRLAWVLGEKLGDSEAAFQVCLAALDDAPDERDVLNLMEAIDTRLGRWERLIETLVYETELTSNMARADLFLRIASIAEENLSDDRRAIEFLSHSLDLRPGDKSALAALERLLGKQGRWRELARVLQRLREIEKDPQHSVEINRRLARLLAERLGEAEAAAQAWQRVLEVGEDAEALDSLARGALAAGRWAELVDYLGRLAPLAPDMARKRAILLRRAQVLAAELAREDDAALVLDTILSEVDPTCLDAARMLRGIHEQRGDVARTAEAMEREILLAPDPDAAEELLTRLAQIYEEELDDPARAISAYERVRELDPDHETAVAALERLYVKAERWSGLLALLRDVADGPMEELARVRLLGRMAELSESKLGDGLKAWGLLCEAFATSPDLDEALENLRQGAARLGKQAELAQVLADTAAKSQSPGQQARWWREASLAYEVGLDDARGALEATLRAFATDPTEASYLDEVDRLAPKADAWDRVGSVYEALCRRTQNPRARQVLLRRHARLEAEVHGDRSQAMDLELRALETTPDDARVLEAIEAHALATGRFEDLIVVYDRRCARADTRTERIDWLLKAARLLHENVKDYPRAFEVLRNALLVDPLDEVHAEEVAQRIKMVDEAAAVGGEHARGQYVNELVAALRELAGQHIDEPRQQSKLLRRIARLHAVQLADSAGAFEALKEAAMATPADDDCFDALEQLASEMGVWEALADHYSRILADAVDPEGARIIHRRRARVLEQQLDRPLEAAEHYWRLWELGPGTEQPALRLKAIFREAKRWNDLLLVFERELSSLDEAKGAEALLGSEGGANEETPSAHGRRLELLREIAHVWEECLANPYEAVEGYERLLAAHPGDRKAVTALERLYRAQSRWDDVVGLLTTARTDAPSEERGAALARGAVVLAERLRRTKAAEATLARALALAPEHPDVVDAGQRVKAALASKDDLEGLGLDGAELVDKSDLFPTGDSERSMRVDADAAEIVIEEAHEPAQTSELTGWQPPAEGDAAATVAPAEASPQVAAAPVEIAGLLELKVPSDGDKTLPARAPFEAQAISTEPEPPLAQARVELCANPGQPGEEEEPLVVSETLVPKPSADTTGELDVNDVLEAVDLLDSEPAGTPRRPSSPPPPPSPTKGKRGRKIAAPPPAEPERARKSVPPPLPVHKKK